MISTLTPPERSELIRLRDSWREDWTRYIERMGVRQWDGQKRIVRALQKYRRVALKSGHRVSKTHTCGSIVNAFMAIYPGARVITTANTFEQVQSNVWGEIRAQYYAAPTWHRAGKMNSTDWTIGEQWEAVGLSTNKPDAIQGKHAPHLLLIFDECQEIPREIWRAADSLMSGPDCYWLVIANPTLTSGPFYDACHDAAWHVETMSCLDHPNIVAGRVVMPGVTPAFVEEYRTKYGEDSDEWRTRICGEFPKRSARSLIGLDDVIRCASFGGMPEGTHMGVDIARFGSDKSIAYVTRDRVIVAREAWSGSDLMTSTGTVLRLMSEHGVEAENVHIDVIGYGAGVVDRLREQGYMVDGVDFASGPLGDRDDTLPVGMSFLNRRAELYWAARQLVADNVVGIPEEYVELRSDLTAVNYSFDSAGRIKVEPKDDIRARIGHSPDDADAYVLSLSRAGSRGPRFAWV